MSLNAQVRWEVADTTARNLIQVGHAEVGLFCRVLTGGYLFQAVAGGTGASCWSGWSDKLTITSFPAVPVTIAEAVDLVGGNGAVVRWASPIAGTISKIEAVINGALTTGNAVLTGKIGSTAITGGVVTCTQSGSAAGSVFSATPSAANVLAVGDVLSFTVSGTQDATKTACVSIAIVPTLS